MDMERLPLVSKGGTSAKDVEDEQDGREQMCDSEENMNSRIDMQPPRSVSVNNKDKANCATSNDYKPGQPGIPHLLCQQVGFLTTRNTWTKLPIT
jgi:hypothetical protein